MQNKTKVAILISGRGSNLNALIQSTKNKDYPVEIALVISNKADAKGIEYAKTAQIPYKIIDNKEFSNREDFDKALDSAITEYNCDFICLAGFMRILSSWFVNKWEQKIINIHPSLLPAFKGDNAIQDALDYGVKYTGCTVHFVSEKVDEGQIIDQAIVEIEAGDTKESLHAKIQAKEHELYSSVLQNLNK